MQSLPQNFWTRLILSPIFVKMILLYAKKINSDSSAQVRLTLRLDAPLFQDHLITEMPCVCVCVRCEYLCKPISPPPHPCFILHENGGIADTLANVLTHVWPGVSNWMYLRCTVAVFCCFLVLFWGFLRGGRGGALFKTSLCLCDCCAFVLFTGFLQNTPVVLICVADWVYDSTVKRHVQYPESFTHLIFLSPPFWASSSDTLCRASGRVTQHYRLLQDTQKWQKCPPDIDFSTFVPVN